MHVYIKLINLDRRILGPKNGGGIFMKGCPDQLHWEFLKDPNILTQKNGFFFFEKGGKKYPIFSVGRGTRNPVTAIPSEIPNPKSSSRNHAITVRGWVVN